MGTLARVVEEVRVSPPPGTVPPADLSLTFHDIIWLQMPPVQRLFYYDFPSSIDDFRTSQFPLLKQSLSLALRLFFPFAGNLVSAADNHVLRYADGDSVLLTLAESRDDFAYLAGNEARWTERLHSLIPPLTAPEGGEKRPLMAVQITVFSDSGVCVAVVVEHVAGDGMTTVNFVKSWAAIAKSGGSGFGAVDRPPYYDRSAVGDPDGELKLTYLEALKHVPQEKSSDSEARPRVALRTFVLTREQIEKLRGRAMASSRAVGPRPSSFALAAGYAWACWVKSRGGLGGGAVYFGFPGDCRGRLAPPLPAGYFGNCIQGLMAVASGAELAAEDTVAGAAAAAEAIHGTIRRWEGDVLADAKELFTRWGSVPFGRLLTTAGSPRLGAYAADFGWGRARKVEVASIARNGAIALAEGREGDGRVEIGAAGGGDEMERFAAFFAGGLLSL